MHEHGHAHELSARSRLPHRDGARLVWPGAGRGGRDGRARQAPELRETDMARKYSPGASRDVERAMRKRKRGTLKSGKGGRGGRVKSRKQAIAIGLSEARKKGKKVPRRASRKK